jgi:hypothetical protein
MTRLELNMKYDDFLIVKGLILTARWKITIISLFYCFVLLIINDTNASKIRVLSSVAFSAIMKHLNNFWIYSMSVTLNKQEHWFKVYRIDWSPLLCLSLISDFTVYHHELHGCSVDWHFVMNTAYAGAMPRLELNMKYDKRIWNPIDFQGQRSRSQGQFFTA